MNKKESNNSLHPGFITKNIALSAIKTMPSTSRSLPKRDVINADLIPKFHEKVVEKRLEKTNEIRPPKKTFFQKPARIQKAPPKILAPQMSTMNVRPSLGEYGRIDPLIRDQTVVVIECPGINKALFVLKMGRRQMTNITLTKEEIMNIIKKVSEKAKIPYMEGSFQAVADNFFINANISEQEIQFIIKKQTPYALLNR